MVFDIIKFGYDLIRLAWDAIERAKEMHEMGYDLSKLKPTDIISTDALDLIAGKDGSQAAVDKWVGE